MQDILISKLRNHIADNHPGLLAELEQEGKLTGWLTEKVSETAMLLSELQANGKPAYIIHESCMNELIKSLGPSKYNYLCSVLQADFEMDYDEWLESGILTYEVINLTRSCDPVFEKLGFDENSEADRFLRYAVTGTIQEYLTEQMVEAK